MTTPAPLAVFMGVNHCGSWSVAEALHGAIGNDDYLAIDSHDHAPPGTVPSFEDQLAAAGRAIKSRPRPPRVVFVHTPLPVHVELPNRQVHYLTMLRDPVQRFISCYTWLYLHKDQPVHWVPPVIRDGPTLGEYVDHVQATGTYPGGLNPCHWHLDHWERVGAVPGPLRRSPFGAVFVLDKHFPVVGITEHFDESLFVFARQLGLARLPRWRRRGQSGARQAAEIDSSVRAKIENLTLVDTTLYTFYRERFLDRHAADIEEFRSLGISLQHGDDSSGVARPC